MSTNHDVQGSNDAESFLIDVRGLKCPLPVLKAAKRMQPLKRGTRIVIIATDPMAAIDIPNFCREDGHEFIEKTVEEDATHYVLIKG